MKKILIILCILPIIVATLMLSSCALSTERESILSQVASSEGPREESFTSEDEAWYENIESENLDVNIDVIQTGKDAKEEIADKENTDTFARIDILLQAKVGGLNVRSQPKSSATVLGSLDKGDYIGFYGEENGWYTTFYKEKRAYVPAAYCEVIEVPAASERVENVINEGKKLLGYPYVWGSERYHWGNGKLNSNFVSGKFDCSALMQYIFYKGNKSLLGLTTREQVIQGQKISKANIERGDLLFFTNSSRKNLAGIERVGHVGLYLGNNLILHTASDYACIEVISKARWDYFISASRM